MRGTRVNCWVLSVFNITSIPLVLATVAMLFIPALGKRGFKCSTGISKSICLPDNYSKFELPYTDKTNEIGISIDIDEVLRINDATYSITFSTYFNVEWKERRLRVMPDFGSSLRNENNVNESIMVPMNLEFIKDLWIPNIFIYNLKTYKVIDVLSKLAGLWITTEKSVLYSQATHITFICPMRFDKFPLDTQKCKFTVGSYSYDNSKMLFYTNTFGYSTKETNSIALDYDIKIVPLKPQDAVLDYGPLGNFSLAGFEMVLTRYVSTYIITYYLPSGLFVIVSWISFLIPMDVIPGRMALLVTLFLVLVNIFNNVTTNTPKAEGLTAIEAWMLACILFVFGALVEYAAILFKKQRYVSGQHKVNLKIICKENYKYEVQEKSPANQAVTVQQLAEEYWRIDKFFLKAFPILFFLFNIVYWLMLLTS